MKEALYQQNLERCPQTKAFEAGKAKLSEVIADLQKRVENGKLPIFSRTPVDPALNEMEEEANRIRDAAETVVVLGTGGSSLGGQMLQQFCGMTQPRGQPQLIFCDNIDPFTLDRLLAELDLKNTHFLVISKSGGTVEPLSQFLICLQTMQREVGEKKLPGHFTLITMPGERPLRQLGERFGLPVLGHDPLIGGRYSVLSRVGLIPALLCGLDIRAIRDGAAKTFAICWGQKEDSPVALGAAMQVAMMEQKFSDTVLMPYSDRLAGLGPWFCQIWAESLGKNGKGSLPVAAVGTVDQHSQLQLWLDGPKPMFFTLILPEHEGTGAEIGKDIAGEESLAYLAGHRLGDIMDAHQHATAETLYQNGLPVRTLHVPRVNEQSLGALIGHFMLETVIAAGLLGVNAFDQPAVEEGKQLARKMLAAKKLKAHYG